MDAQQASKATKRKSGWHFVLPGFFRRAASSAPVRFKVLVIYSQIIHSFIVNAFTNAKVIKKIEFQTYHPNIYGILLKTRASFQE